MCIDGDICSLPFLALFANFKFPFINKQYQLFVNFYARIPSYAFKREVSATLTTRKGSSKILQIKTSQLGWLRLNSIIKAKQSCTKQPTPKSDVVCLYLLDCCCKFDAQKLSLTHGNLSSLFHNWGYNGTVYT